MEGVSNNENELSPEQEELQEARDRLWDKYDNLADNRNDNRGFFDQLSGANELTGIDVMQERANAEEALRQKLQAEMDAEQIKKLRESLSETYLGIDEETGDNTVVAKAADIRISEAAEASRKKIKDETTADTLLYMDASDGNIDFKIN